MGLGGMAVLASMQHLVSANVMAVNFSTANSPFRLYTNYLQGEQVAAYLNRTSQQDGTNVPVAELGVKQATLAGLCLIATEDLPGPLGSYSMVLTAGDPVSSPFGFQGSVAITDPNYYLPTGWVSGTDVWGTDGVAPDEYVGALKGTRKANAIRASDLFMNATNLGGAAYKTSGLYLGERAQDVGPNAGVAWEAPGTNGAPTPDPPPALAGGFGLRVEHFNLAGTKVEPGGATSGVSVVGVTASHQNAPNETADKLNDANPATKWLSTTVASNVRYQLSAPTVVSTYTLTSANDSPARDPRNFTLQGSTNGTTWTTVDTVTGQGSFAGRGVTMSYNVDTPGSYLYYRLNFTAVQSGAEIQLADWALGLPAGTAGDGGSYGLRLKGSINLPKLKIKVVPGAQTQAYCPTAAQ